MPTDPALELERVELTLGGRRILDGLSLTAAAGEITALLGPNGAGKTTTIRCCTGLLRPLSGRIRVLGQDPQRPGALDRVGLMPQGTGAWSGVKPVELLAYLARLYATPLPVTDLVERLGLADFAGTPYRRLSGGQQQLVNLAGALVGRPRLVFLDEPTAGMDPHVRHRTWALIRDLRAAGVAVMLSTHAMDEAQDLADRVCIIDAGRVVVAGSVADLTATQSLEALFLQRTSGGAA